MELVPFKSDDFETYCKVASEFHSGPGSFTDPDEQIFKRNFDKVMSNEPVHGYFIVVDGEIVGYALTTQMYSTEIGGDLMWLEEISISETHQGQGLGSKTIEMLTSMYPNVMRFRLEVAPSNAGAKNLYHKLGFGFGPYDQMFKDVA